MDWKEILGFLWSIATSEIAAPLWIALGALLSTKVPAIAMVIRFIADGRVQVIVNRLYEEVVLEFQLGDKLVSTKEVIDEVFARARAIFPQSAISDDKLRGMVITAFKSPDTSNPEAVVRTRATQ